MDHRGCMASPIYGWPGRIAMDVERDMAMSQNCVWNVPRCSGRMERRGFVIGLVPDLWNCDEI